MARTVSQNSHLDFFLDAPCSGEQMLQFEPSLERSEAAPQAAAAGLHLHALKSAAGIALMLAILPFASFAPGASQNAPLLFCLRLLAEITLVPAFVFLAGVYCQKAALGPWSALASDRVAAFCGFAAFSAAAALLPAAVGRMSFGECFQQNWPFLRFLLLPVLYVGMMRLTGWLPALVVLIFAAFLQIIAMIYSSPTQDVWRYFVFFVAGATAASLRYEIAAWAKASPWTIMAVGAAIIVFASFFLFMAPPQNLSRALNALGPLAILLGAASGLTIWAAGYALAGEPIDDFLQFLGKFSLPIGVAWGPFFLSAAALLRAVGVSQALFFILLCAGSFAAIVATLMYWEDEDRETEDDQEEEAETGGLQFKRSRF